MGKLPYPFTTLALVPPESTTPRSRYDRDIEFLRDPRVSSGYACVYTTDRRRFRARVLKRINIDSFPSAEEAARAVVEWYRWWYGPDMVGGCPKWLLAFYARKANPWRARQIVRGGCKGFIVDVYYHNTPIRVTRKTWRFPGAKTPKWFRRLTLMERQIADNDMWWSREDAVNEARKVIFRRVRSELGFIGINALQLFWRGKDRRRRESWIQAPAA